MRITDHQTASAMRELAPHTYNAMTYLVMAMAKVSKDSGKRTFFGRDKGVAAYKNFFEKLRTQFIAMSLDGFLASDDSDEEALIRLVKTIEIFSTAHPNWRDAYDVAHDLFVVSESQAVAMISRLR